MGISKPTKFLLILSVFIGVHRWPMDFVFAAEATPTPKPGSAFDKATDAVKAAEKETQKLKDAWDQARLEVTLYEKRAKRAYEQWVKAAKDARKEAELRKERAELELKLSVEKRKLAYNEWQSARHRQQAREAEAKEQEQRTYMDKIQKRIQEIEEELKKPREDT